MHIPHYYQQKTWTCGAAAMRMALETVGIKRTEKQLVNLLRTDKVGWTRNRDMAHLVERLKLSYLVHRKGTLKELEDLLKKKYIIIVCYYYELDKVGHFGVVTKIDARYVYVHDPAEGPNIKYMRPHFSRLWYSTKTFEKEKGWYIAVKKKM